jgi:hypothetical protein
MNYFLVCGNLNVDFEPRLFKASRPIIWTCVSGGATGGGVREGQLPPGARRTGRQKRVVSAKEGAPNMTNMTFAPGRQQPWRRR